MRRRLSAVATIVTDESDADLIAAVRSGDVHAYGRLFDRHRESAHRLARQLVRGPDTDDLVAESFARVLATLQKGKGPTESFRAYLLTAMRHLHVDRVRAAQRVRPTDDETELDRHVDWVDPAQMRFEQGAAATAFASLPERWQMVLWHLDVEGQKPGDIAPLLAMSPNSVSALAYRAREGLRQAYLQGHLSQQQSEECRSTTARLGAHVRGGLAARDTIRVRSHLDTCTRCTGLLLELEEVNQNLSGLLAPAVLGAAAAGYLAQASTVVGPVGAAIAGAKAAAVSSGAQGVAAVATVVAIAAGTVVVGGAFDRTPPTPAAAEVTADTAPTSVDPRPAPTAVPPTPAPAEPARATDATPAPSPVVAAARQESTPAAPEPAAAPPKTTAAPVVGVDHAVASVSVTNETPERQRRVTATVTRSASGTVAARTVEVTFAFASPVEVRGAPTDGWRCSAGAGQLVSVVICSRPAADGVGPVAISVAGTTPHGTVAVQASGDPHAGNDSREFTAPVWVAP